MKSRVENLINNKIYSQQINIGTFHSQFLNILRKNLYKVNPNYNKEFKVINESETKKRIKKILKDKYYEKIKLIIFKRQKEVNELKEDELYKFLVKYHIEKISRMKSKGITYDEYNKYEQYHKEDIKNNWEYFQQIYEEYEKGCEKDNVIDFDSILLYTFLLLRYNIKILKEYTK